VGQEELDFGVLAAAVERVPALVEHGGAPTP